MKLNLLDDAIIQLLDDHGNIVFSFELKTLDEYWYGESEEYEYLHVTLGGTSNEYVIIVMTTASGQGGIVAVVDTTSGEIVHYHKSMLKSIRIMLSQSMVFSSGE